jgi:hypothetical protein
MKLCQMDEIIWTKCDHIKNINCLDGIFHHKWVKPYMNDMMFIHTPDLPHTWNGHVYKY